MLWFNFVHAPLAHLPYCTLFAPQNFAQALFSISLGTAVIPRRNEMKKKKKRLCKNFGRQIRCFMGDVQVAYGLISIFLCSLSCLNYHTQKQRKIKLKNKDKIEPQHRQVRKRRNEEGETKQKKCLNQHKSSNSQVVRGRYVYTGFLLSSLYKTKRFHVALPWVCSVIGHRRRLNVVKTSVDTLFSPHFEIICDLLLNRHTATWNLFVK